jgi:hypothetical protein
MLVRLFKAINALEEFKPLTSRLQKIENAVNCFCILGSFLPTLGCGARNT